MAKQNNMLKTLSLSKLFPGNDHHIQAILKGKGAVEVYRIGCDVIYRKI